MIGKRRNEAKALSISWQNIVLLGLFILNLITRGYGIWFRRIAWDEEQFYTGGRSLLRYFYELLLHGQSVNISNDFVSIYGPAGKYLAAIGLAFSELWFAVFGINSAFEPYLFVRIFASLIPSMISVWFIWQLSKKLSDSKWFSYTVVFLAAFAFRWVESAHYATPDSLLAMAVLWAFNAMLNLQKQFRLMHIVALGFAVAIALASKINVGLLLWGIVNVYLIFAIHENFRKNIGRIAKVNAAIVVFSSLLLCPYIVYFSEFLSDISFHILYFPFVVSGHPLIYFLFRPAWGVDWAILLAALFASIVFFIRYKTTTTSWRLILGWVLLLSVYLSFSRGAIPRWEIPLIPALILLAARFIDSISLFLLKYKVQKWLVGTITLFLAIFLIARPAWHILNLDIGLVQNPAPSNTTATFIWDNNCKNVFYNYSKDYSSLQQFIDSDCNCAVISSNFWNDLDSNAIPSQFESRKNNASFIGPASMDIRRFVRENWTLRFQTNPRFETSWTFNPALPANDYVYLKH